MFQLRQLLDDGYRVVVAAEGEGSAVRLADLLRDVADREPHAVTVADEWGRGLASVLTRHQREAGATRLRCWASVAADSSPARTACSRPWAS